MEGADVFIGVSAKGIVSQEMVKTMAKDAIVLPMANQTRKSCRKKQRLPVPGLWEQEDRIFLTRSTMCWRFRESFAVHWMQSFGHQ